MTTWPTRNLIGPHQKVKDIPWTWSFSFNFHVEFIREDWTIYSHTKFCYTTKIMRYYISIFLLITHETLLYIKKFLFLHLFQHGCYRRKHILISEGFISSSLSHFQVNYYTNKRDIHLFVPSDIVGTSKEILAEHTLSWFRGGKNPSVTSTNVVKF